MISEKYILDKNYSSKIILYGEYGVIHGGEILASPLSTYTANWVTYNRIEGYKKELLKIHEYLLSQGNRKIDLDRFLKAIKNGMCLESKIPLGYGLGSSGSISAGIYDVFAFNKTTDLDELKQDLIDIESCFHGVSSGIDPLVIYLDKAIHINSEGINVLDQRIDMSNYFLIDTHIRRKTGPLVDQYVARAKESDYRDQIEHYKTLNQIAIDAQLAGKTTRLTEIIAEISIWQYRHLNFAILDEHMDFWQSTLDRSDVSLKLCGAGGGGFIMGYAEDVHSVIEEISSEFDIVRLG